MVEFWETAFTEKQMMWGAEPAASAMLARDIFAKLAVRHVLIPGIGYGRNAQAFLDGQMTITGIEISDTAIALAQSALGLTIPIHHGSVEQMPFDEREYDGIFCHGLLYLLDAPGRAKFIEDCYRQLALGGAMIFSVIAKDAPMYGRGVRLAENWYERLPGLPMYFYDAASIEKDFGPFGLVRIDAVMEPTKDGNELPFLFVLCVKDS